MRRILIALLLLVVGGLSYAVIDRPPPPPGEEVVIYVVRHAERAEDGTDDPPISQEGEARARLLAETLRDAGVTHVHSTDYTRTRSTAQPFAAQAGLEVASYDPRDLPAFAARLLATPGRHLVVGHSNTSPALVEALGGEAGSPIEEFEYDRLYVVTARSGVPASTVLLRFGTPFEG